MHKILLALLTALTVVIAWEGAGAQQAPDRTTRVFQGTALVLDVIGSAQSRVGDKGDWKKLNPGDVLPVLTSVKTDANAAVLLKFNGAHLFRLGEKTTVTLNQLGVGKEFAFQLVAGNIWSIVRKVNQPAKYEVETPSVVAGVSGTIFAVSHDPDENTSSVSTNVGQVEVQQFDDKHNRIPEKTHVGVGQFVALHRPAGSGGGHGVPALGPPGHPAALVAQPQPPQYRQMWQTMRQQEPMFEPRSGATQFKLSPKIEPAVRPTLFHPHAPAPGGPRFGPNGGMRRGGGMGPGGRGLGAGKPGNNRPGTNGNGVNRPGINRPGANGTGPNGNGINRPGGNGTGNNRAGNNRPGMNASAGGKGAGADKGSTGGAKTGTGKPGSEKPGANKAGTGKPVANTSKTGKTDPQKPAAGVTTKPGAKNPPVRKRGAKSPPDPKHDPAKPGEKKTDKDTKDTK